MKTDLELIEILLEEVKEVKKEMPLKHGLCYYSLCCCHKYTEEEYLRVRDVLLPLYAPLKKYWHSNPAVILKDPVYYFPVGEIQPRIKFLEEIIVKLKSI